MGDDAHANPCSPWKCIDIGGSGDVHGLRRLHRESHFGAPKVVWVGRSVNGGWNALTFKR